MTRTPWLSVAAAATGCLLLQQPSSVMAFLSSPARTQSPVTTRTIPVLLAATKNQTECAPAPSKSADKMSASKSTDKSTSKSTGKITGKSPSKSPTTNKGMPAADPFLNDFVNKFVMRDGLHSVPITDSPAKSGQFQTSRFERYDKTKYQNAGLCDTSNDDFIHKYSGSNRVEYVGARKKAPKKPKKEDTFTPIGQAPNSDSRFERYDKKKFGSLLEGGSGGNNDFAKPFVPGQQSQVKSGQESIPFDTTATSTGEVKYERYNKKDKAKFMQAAAAPTKPTQTRAQPTAAAPKKRVQVLRRPAPSAATATRATATTRPKRPSVPKPNAQTRTQQPTNPFAIGASQPNTKSAPTTNNKGIKKPVVPFSKQKMVTNVVKPQTKTPAPQAIPQPQPSVAPRPVTKKPVVPFSKQKIVANVVKPKTPPPQVQTTPPPRAAASTNQVRKVPVRPSQPETRPTQARSTFVSTPLQRSKVSSAPPKQPTQFQPPPAAPRKIEIPQVSQQPDLFTPQATSFVPPTRKRRRRKPIPQPQPEPSQQKSQAEQRRAEVLRRYMSFSDEELMLHGMKISKQTQLYEEASLKAALPTTITVATPFRQPSGASLEEQQQQPRKTPGFAGFVDISDIDFQAPPNHVEPVVAPPPQPQAGWEEWNHNGMVEPEAHFEEPVEEYFDEEAEEEYFVEEEEAYLEEEEPVFVPEEPTIAINDPSAGVHVSGADFSKRDMTKPFQASPSQETVFNDWAGDGSETELEEVVAAEEYGFDEELDRYQMFEELGGIEEVTAPEEEDGIPKPKAPGFVGFSGKDWSQRG